MYPLHTIVDQFLENIDFCFVRLNHYFPKHGNREDVDILVNSKADAETLATHLTQKVKLENGYVLRKTMCWEGHLHVDLLDARNQFIFKFDFVYALQECFKRFLVSPNYAAHVLQNKRFITRSTLLLPVPCESDELALRFMEYVEHIPNRADKVKHINYIREHPEVVFQRVALSHVNYCNRYERADSVAAMVNNENEPCRYDAFLLWHTGVDRLREVCCFIRDHPCIEIVHIRKKSVTSDDISQFVTDVYALEHVPKNHLERKTMYLRRNGAQSLYDEFLVVVRNTKPRVHTNGTGQWAVQQSKTIVEMKTLIRSVFNPPFLDTSLRIPPLPSGISHDHVVHATDNQDQTNHLLKLFGAPFDVNEFHPKTLLDNCTRVPHHLHISQGELSTRRVTDLYASIVDKGKLSIRDTPHFQFVIGNKLEYEQYHSKHVGTKFTDDHFPEAFSLLISTFDPALAQPLICTKNFLLLDGVHRAAILLARNIETVSVFVLQ